MTARPPDGVGRDLPFRRYLSYIQILTQMMLGFSICRDVAEPVHRPNVASMSSKLTICQIRLIDLGAPKRLIGHSIGTHVGVSMRGSSPSINPLPTHLKSLTTAHT
ncbi:hypothetical protein H2248_001989 [Termitomyces sp. 'cryptogamus']|nr:hypothetical protein H2248_001989 [Termitomyces sp. 'cryptogamus']